MKKVAFPRNPFGVRRDGGEGTEAEAAFLGEYHLLYTSRDGRYCLFENKDGNLVSADARKFS